MVNGAGTQVDSLENGNTTLDQLGHEVNMDAPWQGRSKLDNWGGGGADIHMYVFTHHKNNRFQKKLIVQNTNM